MKVMFLFGGVTHYFDAIIRKLIEQNIDVSVVVPPKLSNTWGEGVRKAEYSDIGYKIIEDQERQSIIRKSYFQNLPAIIDTEKPDILVAGWPYFLSFFFSSKLRKIIRKNGVKFVLREIPFQVPPYRKAVEYFRQNPMMDEALNLLSRGVSFFIRQQLLMQIRRFCYKRADGALSYSTDGLKIMPTYGIDKNLVFVTYNSSDTDALVQQKAQIAQNPPVLPANDYRIIHIGRLVKWKRVDLLLESFQMVLKKFPQAELVVIGDGPELQNLKKQAQQLNINENLLFTGAIYDPATIGAYMTASSLYVLAGMGGLSINDAMTYELPIICSVCDSTEKDLITDGVNGFFFRENDATDLAEKIIQILNDPTLKARMGKASLDIVENKINLTNVSKRFADAFQTIYSNKKKKKQ